MGKVSIVKCARYDENEIKTALNEIVKQSNFPEVENKTVLIKTNILSDAPYSKHITTHPLVIEALIEILQEKKAKEILVGDSPGITAGTFIPKKCGIKEVCDKTGAKWVDFSLSPVTKEIYKHSKVPVASVLFTSDVVISAAKFKTHQLMLATGSVKNMFGTIVGLNKSRQHLVAPSPDEFGRLILSVYKLREPDWALIDSIIGMEGAGPANGTPRQVGLLMASDDLLSLDKAEAEIMGYKKEDVPILKIAELEGKDFNSVLYPNLKPEDLIIHDFRKVKTKKQNLFSSLILPFFTRKRDQKKTEERKAPVFLSSKCKLCKRCVDVCPAKALCVEEGKITIDQTKCIRCYCCHEMCPFDAIKV